MSNEVWAGPWRKSLKGDWVRDIAPSRKERHRKSVQVTVRQEETIGLSVPELKALFRAKAAEALEQLNTAHGTRSGETPST